MDMLGPVYRLHQSPSVVRASEACPDKKKSLVSSVFSAPHHRLSWKWYEDFS